MCYVLLSNAWLLLLLLLLSRLPLLYNKIDLCRHTRNCTFYYERARNLYTKHVHTRTLHDCCLIQIYTHTHARGRRQNEPRIGFVLHGQCCYFIIVMVFVRWLIVIAAAAAVATYSIHILYIILFHFRWIFPKAKKSSFNGVVLVFYMGKTLIDTHRLGMRV